MCCPAGEHVNTEGGKRLPTSSFSHRPEAPPVTHGGKGVGGGQKKSEEEGKEGHRAIEKVLDGRKKLMREEKSGWPKKKKNS